MGGFKYGDEQPRSDPGRVSYHRNLEHAVLELTLFKTCPIQKCKLTVLPHPQVTGLYHPAALLGPGKITGHSLEPDFCSLWIVARNISS